MTVITHMAVGAAVGSLVDGRGAAFLLGLASHVPLDILPHYEFEKMWVEVAVVAAALGTMLVLGLGGTGVFWGAVGAVVPDLENLLWRLGVLPDERKIFPGHSPRLKRFFPHGRSLGLPHALTQVLMVCASVLVVVMNAHRWAN